MDELHVVGHTADRRYLIVARDDASRFSLPVDSELVALVEDLTGERLGGELAADDGGDTDDDEPEAAEPERLPSGLAALGVVAAEPPTPAQPAAGRTGSAAPAGQKDEPAAADGSSSQLPPREIQARLRAGHSVRSVAKAAGTSTERIQPWLRAVEGEREQVLAAWRTARLSRARLGPSHDLLGDAVRVNLRAKGVDPDAASWKVRRTDGQAYWTVELRYTSRGRTQRALYRYYPDRAEVEPRNELAEKIGWTRSAPGSDPPPASEPFTAAARQAAKPAGKKSAKTSAPPAASGSKTTGKQAGGKKAAKKATKSTSQAKKTAASKAGGKKAGAKKAAGAKKTGAKTAEAKKTAAKKATGTTSAGKKAAAKKAAGKKTAAKKAAGKKTAAKKAPGTKAVAKNTAQRSR